MQLVLAMQQHQPTNNSFGRYHAVREEALCLLLHTEYVCEGPSLELMSAVAARCHSCFAGTCLLFRGNPVYYLASHQNWCQNV